MGKKQNDRTVENAIRQLEREFRRNNSRTESGDNGKVYGALRILLIALLVAAQVAVVFVVSTRLHAFSTAIFTSIEVLAVLVVVAMLSSTDSPSYKIVWTFMILLMPFVGLVLYLTWGRVDIAKRERGYIEKSFSRGFSETPQDPAVRDALDQAHPEQSRVSRYLAGCGFPVYRNTGATYYPLGELWWKALLADIEKAERFVFIESFIIEDGELWSSVLNALRIKAAQGLDIRLMYDDLGSIVTIPRKDMEKMRAEGIQVQVFNKTTRYIQALYMNYRNHQKIAVIDGDVAHTGGCNLADEYANLVEKHGHWKDTCVRLRGDAAWGLTVTFLQMWDMTRRTITEDYEPFRPRCHVTEAPGFFQPMMDGPANNPKNPALDLFKLMVSDARKSCYMTSPYLVLDYDLLDALCLAGRSGVDVRIIVPHIPDHWYVHMVTRSFYGELLQAGVRVYEYTPGYIHAKMIAADGTSALIGSVNMDFRSFYLHYEDAVWTCGSPLVSEIDGDIRATLDMSEEIVLEEWKKRPWYIKLIQDVLRVFAPMM